MKTREFPPGFLWGSASSAYQTEGGNTSADWYFWEKQRRFADRCGRASDHYEQYEKDFDLLVELSQNAHRLSFEWSRIEPSPMNLSPEALSHYREVLTALKERGIKVFVTLHHFTNPNWFLLKGGWEKRGNIEYFLRYVKSMVEEFHDLVDFWIILNEPMMYAQMGYYSGVFPPGKMSYWAFRRVMKHLILAHRRCYEQLHAKYKTIQIGIAKNNQYFEPYSSSLRNRLAAAYTKHFWNHVFLTRIKSHLDFIGLNYYFHNRLKFSLLSDWFAPNHFFSRIKNENRQVSDSGVEIFPEGIHKALLELRCYKLPLYVTESGVADAQDRLRKAFIEEHLKYVYIAIKDLCDVRGYFYWSLLDNYEWGSFYPRYGLVEVDRRTMERKIRASARWYAEVCRKNAIEF